MIESITSHEFKHNFSKYKREAKNGPIFITQRGILCNVLLSIEEYEILIVTARLTTPTNPKLNHR